jgi:hypothetical protein
MKTLLAMTVLFLSTAAWANPSLDATQRARRDCAALLGQIESVQTASPLKMSADLAAVHERL